MVPNRRILLTLLVVALVPGCDPDRPTRPPSLAIEGIEFAPLETTVLRADGSDNWPTTWGDDDALYTSWGDGWGFEPATDHKLSLGVARITGGPEDFEGRNIRAPTIEATGDGPAGAKASGLLMVEGVLYMLVRNLGNTRLAWSEDRGSTWTWGIELEEPFGHAGFLEFGRNYEDARDDFVYVYSADGPDAYQFYDRVVLARVPVERIRERDAYEYFVRLDDEGSPVWSGDVADRGAVFTDRGRCANVDVVYVPGIGRYLMTVNANSRGAWGIYDAPEPWGPWTTVFNTDRWDAGDTYSYVFPSKWISDDGRTLYLIFSGRVHDGVQYDAFSLRRAELTPVER